jgi:hypothetical protein
MVLVKKLYVEDTLEKNSPQAARTDDAALHAQVIQEPTTDAAPRG